MPPRTQAAHVKTFSDVIDGNFDSAKLVLERLIPGQCWASLNASDTKSRATAILTKYPGIHVIIIMHNLFRHTILLTSFIRNMINDPIYGHN